MNLNASKSPLIKSLEDCYSNATKNNGLIKFTEEVRGKENDMSGKYNVSLDRIQQLFSNSTCWSESTSGGHITYKHSITKIAIGFSNHKDPVDTGAVVDILNKVQAHLNLLANQIFCSKQWLEEPDYAEAEKRLVEFQKIQGSPRSIEGSPKADGEKKTKK